MVPTIRTQQSTHNQLVKISTKVCHMIYDGIRVVKYDTLKIPQSQLRKKILKE